MTDIRGDHDELISHPDEQGDVIDHDRIVRWINWMFRNSTYGATLTPGVIRAYPIGFNPFGHVTPVEIAPDA